MELGYKEKMCMFYIGIDLGTSTMKLLLMDGAGKIHNTVTKECPPASRWKTGNHI